MTPRPSIFLFDSGRSMWRMECYKDMYVLEESMPQMSCFEDLPPSPESAGEGVYHRYFSPVVILGEVVLYLERGSRTWGIPRPKLLKKLLLTGPRVGRRGVS